MQSNFLKKTHKIHKGLHSTFGEYFGRVIYDGIWVGKDSMIPNINGIRLDVIEGCREAGIAAFRWPGGCCADHYFWKEGIGPKRWDRLHFCREKEPRDWCNDFGTDEFIEFCRLTGMEPIITANTATGTVEDFLAWYEYCNGGLNTRYGALRAENGHPEPYNVHIWGIGNTDENAWHNSSPAACDYMPYALSYLQFTGCTFRPGYDPDLQYIGLGMSIRHGMSGWAEGCLDYITDRQRRAGPHMLSVHHYLGGMKDRACGKAVDFTDDEYTYSMQSLIQYQRDIDTHRDIIEHHTNPQWPTYISFDEWGLWHPEATAENDQNQSQTMRDAIFAALALHIFYRNADIVRYAMETQISNLLHSLFETDGSAFYKTPTFFVFKMFREHLEQYLTSVSYTVSGGCGEMLASVSDDDSRIVLTLVNQDLHKDAVFRIGEKLSDYKTVKSDILTASHVRAVNTFDAPCTICDKPFGPFSEQVILPPFSIVRFVLEK